MHRSVVCTVLAAVPLSAHVPAQSSILRLVGEVQTDHIGGSVADAGDVDGDGTTDILVGGAFARFGVPVSGGASVLSGATGATLHTWHGSVRQDHFGGAVEGAGDVDGDGHADVYVSAQGDALNGRLSGSVFLYSGRDGTVLRTLTGDSAVDWFGGKIAIAGDVNGDGQADLLVNALGDVAGGRGSGSVYVYSGSDGSQLHAVAGVPGQHLGAGISGAGDVDMDGLSDFLAVGVAPVGSGYFRTVNVYSGADGALLRQISGGTPSVPISFLVEQAGDVDADGIEDVIFGLPNDGTNGVSAGGAVVYSGRTWDVLLRIYGQGSRDHMGWSVSGAGDVDGDGHADVAIGSPYGPFGSRQRGRVTLVSGAVGNVLYRLDGAESGDLFGYSIARIGDLDQGGIPNLIVGAPGSDKFGSCIGCGEVRVIYGADPVGSVYCSPAVPNSTGTYARLRAIGSDRVPRNDVLLRASSLPPGSAAVFLTSRNQAVLPSIQLSQGTLCLGTNIGHFHAPGQVMSADAAGSLDLRIDLRNHPQPTGLVMVQPGETWNLQVWYRDANPMTTTNFTEAVSITFR